MAVPSFVQQEFAQGIIVTLVKEKAADLGSTHNYRGITYL